MNQKMFLRSRRRWSEFLPALSAILIFAGVTDAEGVALINKFVVGAIGLAGSGFALWTHLRPDGATLKALPKLA